MKKVKGLVKLELNPAVGKHLLQMETESRRGKVLELREAADAREERGTLNELVTRARKAAAY